MQISFYYFPMHKLYFQLIGLPVFDEASSSPVTLIKDVIIDPENGKVLAFLVRNGEVIISIDVERITSEGLFIADRDRVVPVDDVFRVHNVLKMDISLAGMRVISQRTKAYLGRVVDFEIDTKQMMLVNIHVAKTMVFFRFNERIFSYRNIVRISKGIVIVKDSSEIRAEEKARVRSEAFA